MANHPDIVLVPAERAQVACNGGGGALGHPKVYYSFDGHDDVTCGYCGCFFTKTLVPGARPLADAAA